jgi:fumarylacetoacetase
MTIVIDETHDPALRSWVETANGHADFPLQNLPFGVFSFADGEHRGGVAIGDSIVDLALLRDAKLLASSAQTACEAACTAELNDFFALGSAARIDLRHGLSALLREGSAPHPELLHSAADCRLYLPLRVGDYTDFYAGIHHAQNVGQLFRPDEPLMPNYKWMPIGYHGRASSVCASGADVRRPQGQRLVEDKPVFGPTQRLDYELELGIWVGRGNALGTAVPIDEAAEHIAGYCLLNDWSARDLQAWEYRPLGPFLGKSFHTTVSPWVITPEALAPFRAPQRSRPAGDPAPLPHLAGATDQRSGALNLALSISLSTAAMRANGIASQQLAQANALDLYWTPAQMLTHHASNGCNLRPGDLLGTGTISGATASSFGSLLELTCNGAQSFSLGAGETRRFLEDGDEVMLSARAMRDGFVSIGFGPCRARVLPAH